MLTIEHFKHPILEDHVAVAEDDTIMPELNASNEAWQAYFDLVDYAVGILQPHYPVPALRHSNESTYVCALHRVTGFHYPCPFFVRQPIACVKPRCVYNTY